MFCGKGEKNGLVNYKDKRSLTRTKQTKFYCGSMTS